MLTKIIDPTMTPVEQNDANIEQIMDAINGQSEASIANQLLTIAMTMTVTFEPSDFSASGIITGEYSAQKAPTHGLGFAPILQGYYYTQTDATGNPIPYAKCPFYAGDGLIGTTYDWIVGVNTITARATTVGKPTQPQGLFFFLFNFPLINTAVQS